MVNGEPVVNPFDEESLPPGWYRVDPEMFQHTDPEPHHGFDILQV